MKKLSFLLVLCLMLTLFAGCGDATTDSQLKTSDTSSISSVQTNESSKQEDATQSVVSDSSSQKDTTTSSEVKDDTSSTSSPSTPTSTPSQNTPTTEGIKYITKGLVARYDFEDASNIGKDVSGNNHNLFVWSNSGKTVGQVKNSLDSKLGKAASFDGNALLAAKKSEDSKVASKDFIDSLNGSYTITFFAKNNLTNATAEESHRNLICNGYWNNPTSPNLELAFTYKKDGDWDAFASYLNYGGVMNNLYFRKFAWQADNGGFYKYGKIDTNWYHYAVVVNTEKVCVDLYIDGKLVKSNAPGTQGLATQSDEVPFSIGGMAVPNESVPVRDMLIGEIDDLRVYNRVLTVYEIGNIKKFNG